MEKKPVLNSRRGFLKDSLAVVVAGSTLSETSSELIAQTSHSDKRLKLAIVGTGIRGLYMWGSPVEKEYSDRVRFVGLCDINPKRVEYAKSLFKSSIPVFTNFDKMIRDTKPDTVIVTTIDGTHAQYVVRAMELGCDVISEKPLATTVEDCQAIYDAEIRTGRSVTVGFNARHGASATKIRELLSNGTIGELYSIDYAEMLDLSHGADYFRRWHGRKENSGTLLVHKACHHFDQVNWWIQSDPVQVTALGDLKKYGTNGPFRSTHCRKCSHKDDCQFYWDITKEDTLRKLYVDCEEADGYLRDACLYRKEIDIYDTMAVQCLYENGVVLSYSLNATSPIEGQIISFNGSKGRLELRGMQQQPSNSDSTSGLRLILNNSERSEVVPTESRSGEGHGGADSLLRQYVFQPEIQDPLGYRAGSRAGILSSLIGIAAYTSIESQKSERVADLINWS